MANPIKIRALMVGDKVEVRALIAHPMETGQRRDAAGKSITAHFIQTLTVTHNGKVVLNAQWGPAVSQDPFLQFRFTGGKPGEKVIMTWVDNKRATRTDEAVITG
jgi:sulfur-oxidizing protein SoxZ